MAACRRYDKEWMTAGPRPDGVQPTCFTPITHTATACNPAVIGSDRLYVTYSLFSRNGSAQIFLEYSDDQARSFSPPKYIAGSGAFCAAGGRPANACADSQGSEPTVNPTTGQLWVGFENGDTADEDQYLVVTSTDGGVTFSPPVRVDTLYDVNEPRGVNGRTDCVARGQGSTRVDLTNTCFRADPIFNSIVADKRGGAFANDVYVVLYDNRNGTIRDSNNDVFFYKSTDGGTTWIGPTRVNNDPSTTPANRDCGRNTDSIAGNSANCPEQNYGGDQYFAYVSISQKGRAQRDVPRPAARHVVAGRQRSVADEQDRGRQLPRLELGRAVHDHPDPDGHLHGDRSGSLRRLAVRRPGGGCQPDVATGFDPGAGPVPGQNQNSATLPFRNFQISDFGTNWDYTFRAGIFAGDYNGNTTGPKLPNGDEKGGNTTAAFWTDARNGRGSGAPTSFEAGRNPICEQSDVFFQAYNSSNGGNGPKGNPKDANLFLVAPCPGDLKDKKQK